MYLAVILYIFRSQLFHSQLRSTLKVTTIMTSLDPLVTAESDLYGLLNVEPTATDAALKRAYRKVALKFHPDKNPSADAAAQFHFLSIALETLTTPALRARYDTIRAAKAEARARTNRLDHERRRMKEDLERRERDAADATQGAKQHKRKVEILKEEGKKMRKMRDDSGPGETAARDEGDESTRVVLIRYRDSQITETALHKLLSSFGSIDTLRIVPHSKYKKAVVVFHLRSAAQACATLLADPAEFASRDPFYASIQRVSSLSNAASPRSTDSNSETDGRSGGNTPVEARRPIPNASIAERLATLRSRITAQKGIS